MSAVIETVPEVTQEEPQVKSDHPWAELAPTLKSIARISILCALVWVACYAFFLSFPYIRNSTDVVLSTKKARLINEWTYPENAQYRIFVMGNSRILSGFIPSEFDTLDPNTVYSINAGLPGSAEFIPELEGMVARGQIPTHVFLTVPWSEESLDNELLKTVDDQLMNKLFPFRTLIHDIGLFLQRSSIHGGIQKYYDLTRSEAETMIEKRGYLFIVTQSRYPNDILPDDYSEPLDTPNEPAPPRVAETEGEVFKKLLHLSETYGIKFVFVPSYTRDSHRAEAPERNMELEASLAAYPNFHVMGSDYVLYPHLYFADSVHLNPNGGIVYTRMLRDMFANEFYDASAQN